jgi:hypothetical protein
MQKFVMRIIQTIGHQFEPKYVEQCRRPEWQPLKSDIQKKRIEMQARIDFSDARKYTTAWLNCFCHQEACKQAMDVFVVDKQMYAA